MAITFNKACRSIVLGSGIMTSLTDVSYTTVPGTQNVNILGTASITVFSGVQPAAATIVSSWTSYNSTFLCHWSDIRLIQTNTNNINLGNSIMINSISSAVTASNTGTATWGIIWPSNPTQLQVSATTIPSGKFIVVPTGALGQSKTAIVISSINIVSGSQYTINDVVIASSGGI